MKKYDVNLTLTKYCEYSKTIEAETEEDALEIARDEARDELDCDVQIEEEYNVEEIEN